MHAGYWSGKMVSAILLHRQLLKSILEIVLPHRFMGTVNFSPTKDCNRNSSSRCPMRSITTEKGMQYLYILIDNILSFCVTLVLFFSCKILKQSNYLQWSRLIGKVAADHSHKWIYKEPNDQEINFLSAWHNSADSVRKKLKPHLYLSYACEVNSIKCQI